MQPFSIHVQWRTLLAAAALALVAGCGGSDDDSPPPNPNPNGALAGEAITAAQATVEPAPSATVDAGAAVLSAGQIDTQQRTAVERAVLPDTGSIAERQAALDAGEDLEPAF